jgi:CubicO group peptidase (beta-lactamase class C family)
VITPLALALLFQLAPPRPDPKFAPVADFVTRGIQQGVYPGAVVIVGQHDSILYARGFGRLTWSASSPAPSTDSTRWDLASLTKVIATTSALMVLVDRGRVDLDAPVVRYLPRFDGENRRRITVRMLLDHTSGLRAYVALYQLAPTRAEAIDRLYLEQPVRVPGRSAAYSDINAMLLGLLVEAVTGESLSNFSAREVFVPLRLGATAFAPSLPPRAQVAPSRTVSGRPLPGRVDDANAFRLGGVAGHAGLFATGNDVARFAQAWLRRGKVGDSSWVSTRVMQEFLQRSERSGSRVLGWDTPELGGRVPSIYGALAGARTYGHTGWTGTMLWVDPDRDLFLVFLTNRSLAPRARNSLSVLRGIRSSLSDLVIRLAQR